MNDLRHALPVCAVISLALHLILLTARIPSESPRRAASGTQAKFQVRVVSNGSESTEPLGTTQEQSAMAAELTTVPERGSVVSPDRNEAVAERAHAKNTENALQPGPEFEAPTNAGPTAAANHDDYLPRAMLSVPPVVQTPVIIAAPEDETQVGRHVGILSLFIDEEGRVQRVTGHEPLLPPVLEEAARKAFMDAQFAPGELDGRPVKSRTRVEVVFDNVPLAKP
ncbi:energy transducer TonB [Variovorax paradoxus]|nr:energy transducer TonB [Variovorax paradoxus]